MTDYQAVVRIVDAYMQAISAGDYAAAANLYADDAKLEDPVGSEVIVGKGAILAFYQGSIGSDGTQLACQRTGPVRYANQELVFPFECLITADGAKMKISIIDHFVLNEDGLITSMRAFWSQDTMDMVT